MYFRLYCQPPACAGAEGGGAISLQRTVGDIRPDESARRRCAVVVQVGWRIGHRFVVIVVAGRMHHELEAREFARKVLVGT